MFDNLRETLTPEEMVEHYQELYNELLKKSKSEHDELLRLAQAS